MITLWYAYDDALAEAFGVPGVGAVPFWVWVMLMAWRAFWFAAIFFAKAARDD